MMEKINKSDPAECEYKTDIVIAGGGLSGLSAALTAVEKGVDVIVLEKLHFPGGAGLFPEGSLGIGSKFQVENGIDISVEKVFERVMEFHHWRCNARVIARLLNESGKTINWLMENGVEIIGIKTLFPPEKSLNVWHLFRGGGARVVKIMSKKIKAGGGLILTNTRAERLLFDEKKKISGLSALSGDKKIKIRAKAVILSTGGFTGSRQMLEKYVPDITMPGMARLMYRGPEIDGRTGDGINIALSADASLAGMETLAGNSPYLDHEPAIKQFRGPDYLKQTRCALSQPFLWVNKRGERFYNESAGSVFSDVYNAMTSNGGIMWSVFDENMKHHMVENGPLTPFNAIVVPGDKMTSLDEGIKKGIESGFAYKASSIEKLAEKINIEPSVLISTVESINRYADQGKDPEFNRKPEHLIRFNMENGPYYALKGLRAFFLTLGGVRTNTGMQALDSEGNVIPGLYVTGQDMGGLYDTTYDLLAEGSASSFAISSGRIAAETIINSTGNNSSA